MNHATSYQACHAPERESNIADTAVHWIDEARIYLDNLFEDNWHQFAMESGALNEHDAFDAAIGYAINAGFDHAEIGKRIANALNKFRDEWLTEFAEIAAVYYVLNDRTWPTPSQLLRARKERG